MKILPSQLTLLVLLVCFCFGARAENPIVVLETNHGNLEIELFADKAPVTVENFLAYVDDGFYDNTIFHRIVKNFVIQGGGFNKDFVKKTTKDPIINESKNRVHNDRGTIAMARTQHPDSATSQFYINLANNGSLDYRFNKPGYAVFGIVIRGMDVAKNIARLPIKPVRQHSHAPLEPVVLEKVTRKTKKTDV